MFNYFRSYLFSYNNLKLIEVLSKRNFESRYKGSILGGLWAILNQLIMMLIYTFVFSFVLKAKWGDGHEVNYSIILYTGLILFIACSDIIMTSVSCVRENVNYVKKIVFPLEILPIVNVVVSYMNFLVSLVILELFYIVVSGKFSIDILYLSVFAIPLFILSLGIGYF
ncbi:ABC transporter permease [Photobacterium damselae]|uniref:ABC transporter permease n=1 Tax=Photobacterium damselae TaxID=38293 RepID=UPI0039C092AC|nr:ABC transporter permease [Photobacterium damselae subsp. damselae]